VLLEVDTEVETDVDGEAETEVDVMSGPTHFPFWSITCILFFPRESEIQYPFPVETSSYL